jgi:UDP-N-acetylmuramoyl-tripeptide--D-alanyl-D-alanine ligase
VGAYAATRCDWLVAVGPRARGLAAAAREAGLRNLTWLPEAESAIALLRRELRAGDVVLVKASHATALDRVVAALEAA